MGNDCRRSTRIGVPDRLRRLIGLVAAVNLMGCSLFGPRMQTVTISSDPPHAIVRVNGSQVGRTPLRTQVRRGEDLLVEVHKDGYETEFRGTSRTLSGLGILDVVGGSVLLIPFLGLISSAAWKHQPSTFGVSLVLREEAEE